MPNENDMMDKNAMLIEAYRIQVERWNKRRDIEWRLTLTLWSTILIITFALAGKYQFPCYIGVAHLILFGMYIYWIIKLWERNRSDKDQMDTYQEKINKKLGIDEELDDPPDKAWNDWSMRSQLGFTLLILSCSFLILYYTPKSELTVLARFLLKMFIK